MIESVIGAGDREQTGRLWPRPPMAVRQSIPQNGKTGTLCPEMGWMPVAQIFWCPLQDSNLRTRLRRPVLYPLS